MAGQTDAQLATDALQSEFSIHPAYRGVNEALIEDLREAAGTATLGSLEGKVLVDIGTGGGAFLGIVHGLEGAVGRLASALGIDSNHQRIADALQSLKPYGARIRDFSEYAASWLKGPPPGISLVKASASHIPLPRHTAHFAIIGNAIHLIIDSEVNEAVAIGICEPMQLERVTADKLDEVTADYVARAVGFLDKVGEVLRPGGLLAFNTTYFAGGIDPSTLEFYKAWTLGPVRQLFKEGLVSREVIEANRNSKRAMLELTPAQYALLLEMKGFKVVSRRELPVELDAKFFEGIAQYDDDFVRGVLTEMGGASNGEIPRNLFERTRKLLVENVAAKIERYGTGEPGNKLINRYWLQVVAQRA